MSFSIILPIGLGIIAGYVVNYFADILPFFMKICKPVCLNPSCEKIFSWKDYFLLHSCRNCSRRRIPRTFIVLVLCSIAAFLLWFNHPVNLGFLVSFILLMYLFLVAIIDFEHRLILRPLSITGLIFGAICGFLLHGWLGTLRGGLVGFSIMFIFYLFGRYYNHLKAKKNGQDPNSIEEALGSGDVTLATILGLLLGWPLIWFGLLMGALIGGLISLAIIIIMVIIQRKKGAQAMMTLFPLSPAYILSAVVLIYFPSLVGHLLPLR